MHLRFQTSLLLDPPSEQILNTRRYNWQRSFEQQDRTKVPLLQLLLVVEISMKKQLPIQFIPMANLQQLDYSNIKVFNLNDIHLLEVLLTEQQSMKMTLMTLNYLCTPVLAENRKHLFQRRKVSLTSFEIQVLQNQIYLHPQQHQKPSATSSPVAS